jgi:NAD-dependent dihydropyrimidine dehydrogenase PreA subunit
LKQARDNCPSEAGAWRPVIDRNRCEGKAACVQVCPFDVFALGILTPEQRRALSWRGKIKGFAHRWQQAFTVNEDACHSCGYCVAACPEQAISLQPND